MSAPLHQRLGAELPGSLGDAVGELQVMDESLPLQFRPEGAEHVASEKRDRGATGNVRGDGEDPAVLEGIRYTPSAALGTSRIKPKPADLERALEVFKAHDIRYFFYIGGNDTAESTYIIN